MILRMAVIAAILSLILAVPVAIISALPRDDAALTAFFDCEPFPCWRGIVPGVSHGHEVMRVLVDDPQVEGLIVSGTAGLEERVTWRWRDHAPVGLIRRGNVAQIGTMDGMGPFVQYVLFITPFRLGDAWFAYFTSDKLADVHELTPSNYVVRVMMSEHPFVALTENFPCPLTFGTVLQQQFSLSLHNASPAPTLTQTPTELRRAIIEANRQFCA